MSSLRLRLLVAIGTSFALFWSISSVLTLVNLRGEFRDAFDERLAASARMVAALVADAPQLALRPGTSLPAMLPALAGNDSVACEIAQVRGAIVGRTRNSPDKLGLIRPGFHTRTIDGVAWRSYTVEQNGIRITTADRVERRQQLFQNIAIATFVPFLIAMLATLLALGFAIRVGLRPLERIRFALASRDPDTLQPLRDDSVPHELVPLVATVNGLLDKVARAIERERRFTGDAAHELRTPLTAVKTHLQVARISTDQQGIATALDRAEQGVRRLQSTIDQLLMLARVEGTVSFLDDEKLDAGAIAEQVIGQLPAAQVERLRVHNDAPAAVARVPASLAMTALRNIVDNAFRHGARGDVALHMHAAGGAVTFVVTDAGAGMDDADMGKAGQRFWRKGAGHGSGLGLSIVNAIVTRYGGTWELKRHEHGGLVVRMSFPADEHVVPPEDAGLPGP